MSDAQAPRSSDAAPPATAPPATGSPDGAAPIERATGLDWPTIAAAFNDAGGAALTHAELARTVEPLFTDRVDNAGWWAQGATVVYEQSIGRRVAGQSSAGDFQVAASRTLPGAGGELRARAVAEVLAAEHLAGLSVGSGGRESDTPKRLYWRTGLGGGAKLAVSVEPKADDRCLVTLTATGLDSQEQREEVRTALRAVVGALG
ncbi:MAG: hypothetical protein ACTHVY_04955 [Brevibacterium yomogidense]|nr:hypothetical protein [Brevibacterium yomogidense]